MPSKKPGKRQDPIYQAQDILSRRDHSRFEVEQKLRRKGFAQGQIAETIAWLQEQNLVDDARFAKMYVENTLRFKAVGPRWLAAKLKQKGIADSIIEETLSKTFLPLTKGEYSRHRREGGGGYSEEKLIHEATEQWKKSHPKHAEDKQRLFRFLASRGFTIEKISANMKP